MQGIRVAIATNSMGKPQGGHTLPAKLEAAKRHGFEGVELAFECLEKHANSEPFVANSSRADRLRAAAKDVHKRATTLSLEIIAMMPFMSYDGLADANDVNERLEEAELWLQLLDILHIPIMQVGTLTPS